MLVRKRLDKSKLVYKLMLDTIQQQHERRYDICKQIIKVLGLKFKLELKEKNPTTGASEISELETAHSPLENYIDIIQCTTD